MTLFYYQLIMSKQDNPFLNLLILNCCEILVQTAVFAILRSCKPSHSGAVAYLHFFIL